MPKELPSDDQILVRAKKMAGALGRIPSPSEFRERFAEKGVELTLGQARSLFMKLRGSWANDRGIGSKDKPHSSSTKAGSVPTSARKQKSGRSFPRKF